MSEYLLYDEQGYHSARVEGGRPVIIEPSNAFDTLPFLSPGLIDIHIHGGFGIDVMNADRSELERLDDLLRERCAYDGWLPTTVTCTPEAAFAVLEALPDRPSVLGLHLEGPFLSPKHPGAQPPQHLAEYQGPGSAWDAVLDHPKLRLVTLAPEIPGGMELIRRLVARGVIVSLGHTDATWEQTEAAVAAGARHFTHAFNAMRPFHHREPGIVGYLLAKPYWLSDESAQPEPTYAEIIYDRLHVHPDTGYLLHTSRRRSSVISVSDGTMAIGLAAGTRLTMWGHDCIVGEGDVRLASNGGLAGSATHLGQVFAHTATDFGHRVALWSCAKNPRITLGLPEEWGTLVAFDPDLRDFRRLD